MRNLPIMAMLCLAASACGQAGGSSAMDGGQGDLDCAAAISAADLLIDQNKAAAPEGWHKGIALTQIMFYINSYGFSQDLREPETMVAVKARRDELLSGKPAQIVTDAVNCLDALD